MGKASFGIIMIIIIMLMHGFVIHGARSEKTQIEEWNFVELARVTTGGDAYMSKVEGKYCYITCGYSGFRIFDISNLSAPHQVAHITQSADGYAHQFILHENVAFIGNGNGGIWIINCTNPENPNVVREYNHDYSWDIQLIEDIIYAGNGHIYAQESVTVTNISDITNPIHIKTILTDDDTTDLSLINNRLYAASSTKGLLIFDITNRTDPIMLGKYIDPQNPDIYLVSFDIVEQYVYAVYYQYGFRILNVSDPTNITVISELTNESNEYYSIHVINDVAYISDISQGIQLINLSSKINPEEIIQYTYENCGTNDVFKQDEILFVADRNIGLLIFNTSKNINDVTTSTFSETISATTSRTPYLNIWLCVLVGVLWIFVKRKNQNSR